MSKENEFIKNTIILLLGKFSTQIVSFLLLPLYTYKLSTSDYGYVDLAQTYISLLVPILLLQLDSGVFRYLIDIRKNEENKKKIIASSFYCICTIIFIIIMIIIIIKKYIEINYFYSIILNIFILVLNMYMMSIARGNGNNKHYAISSCIMASLNLIINAILIINFKYNAESILISASISNAISLIYIFFVEKVYKYIKIKYIDLEKLKELLKYSIPMIPNALSWWIVGLSDRTIIVNLLNVSANGIYSIACKFSNLLNSVFSIFSMSWQETASLHINDDDAGKFFSKMITNIFNFFVIISCIIVGILPLMFNVVIGAEYKESYNYIPILLLGNIFNVLVGLLGGIYVAKKMTKKVAMTTIGSAIFNIIINLIFIRKIGLYAACLSTVIAYFIMSIYRYHDIKKYLDMTISIRKCGKYLTGFVIILLPYYYELKYISIIMLIIICIIYTIENRDIIIKTIKKIKKK